MHSFCRPTLFVSLFLFSFSCATADVGGDGGVTITPDSAPGTPDANQSGPCVLVPQSGCQNGEACDLDSNGNPVCRAVAVAGTELDTCANLSECAAGYVCAGINPDYSCLEYCTSDTQCAGPGGRCVIVIGNATTCSQNCEPTTASGCPAGWNCLVQQNMNMTLYTACFGSGAAGLNAACTQTTECQQGLMCADAGNGLQCYQVCSTANPACGVGTCNTNFNPPLTIGTKTYGICL